MYLESFTSLLIYYTVIKYLRINVNNQKGMLKETRSENAKWNFHVVSSETHLIEYI